MSINVRVRDELSLEDLACGELDTAELDFGELSRAVAGSRTETGSLEDLETGRTTGF